MANTRPGQRQACPRHRQVTAHRGPLCRRQRLREPDTSCGAGSWGSLLPFHALCPPPASWAETRPCSEFLCHRQVSVVCDPKQPIRLGPLGVCVRASFPPNTSHTHSDTHVLSHTHTHALMKHTQTCLIPPSLLLGCYIHALAETTSLRSTGNSSLHTNTPTHVSSSIAGTQTHPRVIRRVDTQHIPT